MQDSAFLLSSCIPSGGCGSLNVLPSGRMQTRQCVTSGYAIPAEMEGQNRYEQRFFTD